MVRQLLWEKANILKHKLAYTLLFLMLAGVAAIEEHCIHNHDCELNATKEGEKCLLEDMDSIHNLVKFPCPHVRMCEDYFSVSTASGGLSIMAAKEKLEPPPIR